jgi:hypothetical protein
MNVENNKIKYYKEPISGAELSYEENTDDSRLAYIEASDSIKAKCGDKEITILDNNGNTNLQKIYIDGDDSFISDLDTLISIFENNFTEEQAKELCRNIGKAIGATSNY